jgi:hypothetical protein
MSGASGVALGAAVGGSGSGGQMGHGSSSDGSETGAHSPPVEGERRQSDGVYQHTDMGSAIGEEEEVAQEIPPK